MKPGRSFNVSQDSGLLTIRCDIIRDSVFRVCRDASRLGPGQAETGLDWPRRCQDVVSRAISCLTLSAGDRHKRNRSIPENS